MRFKVTGGVNEIGRPTPIQTTDLKVGAHGGQRFGSMTSPISGAIPPDRSIHLPPSFAERSHDLTAPNFARVIEVNDNTSHIKTNKTHQRNIK